MMPMTFMTDEEIAAYQPYAPPNDGPAPLQRARRRMEQTGHWHDGQYLGRRWPIGCVALEITQRCNLDCTLCYLSESSQALMDIPLQEVFRRIDMIRAHYGPYTDVQVTGGDPTLRRRDELIAIVRKLRASELRPSLFTNGIKATRDLLEELCEAGLIDVAFHVDITQQRRGYGSEVELHALREEYIERARGLPLAVMFNTTVCEANFQEVPQIAEFFVRASEMVRLASFQLQADTGRGVLRGRNALITSETVADQIRRGAKADIRFDGTDPGHPSCNRFAMTLVANGHVYDLFDDPKFIRDLLARTAHLQFDRTNRRQVLQTLAGWSVAHPSVLGMTSAWLARKAWQMKKDLVLGGGKVNKLSFFIHNFMDACHLERDRIDACIFMVATADGPLSMCLHNAKRDRYLLQPVEMKQGEVIRFWNPLTGRLESEKPQITQVRHSRKTARGRAKLGLEDSPLVFK